MLSLYYAATGALRRLIGLPGAHTFSSSPVWLLGRVFEPLEERIQREWSSIIWCSYRSNFSTALHGDRFFSDSGWGCMLRVCQMQLAEGLKRCCRDLEIRSVVRKFIDVDRPDVCPLGIHQFIEASRSAGRWFGPSEISSYAKRIWKPEFLDGVQLHLAHMCSIYRSSILQKERMILLIPLQLGVDGIDAVHMPLFKKSLMHPNCIGIAGGKPRSALFFVGFQGIVFESFSDRAQMIMSCTWILMLSSPRYTKQG